MNNLFDKIKFIIGLASMWCAQVLAYDSVYCRNPWDCSWWVERIEGSLPENIYTGTLIEVIFGFLKKLLPYVLLAAFIALIYAWVLYITVGAWSKADDAKKIIKFVAYWIILIMLSYSILTFLVGTGT